MLIRLLQMTARISKHRLVVMIAAGLIISVVIVCLSPTFKECVKTNQGAEAYKATYNSPSAFVGVAYWCLGVFVKENGEGTTALATVVMAIFTGTLWWASTEQGRLIRQSIDLARDEFRASHRPEMAIVFVRLLPANPNIPDDAQPRRVEVGLINRGTGVAHVRGGFIQLQTYYPTDLPHPLQFKDIGPDILPGIYGVGAFHTIEVSTGPDGGAQIAALSETHKRIYLLGWIVYADESPNAGTRFYIFCRQCMGEGQRFRRRGQIP